jgi:hypothetical protein
MLVRVGIALVGALVVTFGLLWAMDEVTTVFREQDPTRYFRISDILARPADRRPDRPDAVALPPEADNAEFTAPDANLPIEAPAGGAPGLAIPLPDLERPIDRPDGVTPSE